MPKQADKVWSYYYKQKTEHLLSTRNHFFGNIQLYCLLPISVTLTWTLLPVRYFPFSTALSVLWSSFITSTMKKEKKKIKLRIANTKCFSRNITITLTSKCTKLSHHLVSLQIFAKNKSGFLETATLKSGLHYYIFLHRLRYKNKEKPDNQFAL